MTIADFLDISEDADNQARYLMQVPSGADGPPEWIQLGWITYKNDQVDVSFGDGLATLESEYGSYDSQDLLDAMRTLISAACFLLGITETISFRAASGEIQFTGRYDGVTGKVTTTER